MNADWDEGKLTAVEYETVTGTPKHDDEQRLLRTGRITLMTRRPKRDDTGEVDSVTLVGEGADAELAVIFRVANRPGRTFGWRIAIWPAPSPEDVEAGSPESLAGLFPVYLDEAVNTIPFHHAVQAPDHDGVEWVLREG